MRQDVLLALSEEVHRVEAEKNGVTIDLPERFQAKVKFVVFPACDEGVHLSHVPVGTTSSRKPNFIWFVTLCFSVTSTLVVVLKAAVRSS